MPCPYRYPVTLCNSGFGLDAFALFPRRELFVNRANPHYNKERAAG